MSAGTSHGEEARAYLQDRLRVLSKVLGWGFGGFMAFVAGLYVRYPRMEPASAPYMLAAVAVLVAMLVLTGRVVLRRPRPEPTLHAIDLIYMTCFGVWCACSAYFSAELHAAGYTALLLGIFVVFTRAIMLPTSARRTAALSSITLGCLVISSVALAFKVEQDIPGPAFVIGAVTLSAVAVVLATLGSSVLYGLRQQFDASKQLGQYTLERKIGEGGMGVVYRAHHVLLRRPTAIKIVQKDRLGADALDRFEREVQHTSQLSHPNTIAVFDYGRSPDGTFYYAMEYLDGVDLEKLVRSFGPQPAGRVIRILDQVCGALQEAHERGVIHRDIKPANIILCARGGQHDIAKVVDFGLAKEIAAEGNTTQQIILGTPSFLAPEAITAPSTVGAASDLYALGAVAFYLLTGKRVFEGKTNLDVCLKHVTLPPPPLRDLAPDAPPALADAIMRCLEKDPAHRFPDAAALARALRAADPQDWRSDDARRWWAAHAIATDLQPLARDATQTVTIDLGARA